MDTRLHNNRVEYYTNIFPHYRFGIWNELLKCEKWHLEIFYGRVAKSGINEGSKESFGKYSSFVHDSLRNIRIGGILVWQIGVIKRALIVQKAQSYIFMGDMNVLSTWVASTILRIRGAHVIFWGHGMYGNEAWIKRMIRVLFLRIPQTNIVYGNRARQEMVKSGINTRILVVGNSLDTDSQQKLRHRINIDNDEWDLIFPDTSAKRILFIGRLTQLKRIDLLIDAVVECNRNAMNLNLLIVGDGPMMSSLKDKSSLLGARVCFLGAIYKEEHLSRIIGGADLCVSPGNVGLTAMHAMSYGTPVCTHDKFELQMPEHEAILPGKTGIFFSYDRQNLSSTIAQWFDLNLDRNEIRKNCYQVIDNTFNPKAQLRIFEEALEKHCA